MFQIGTVRIGPVASLSSKNGATSCASNEVVTDSQLIAPHACPRIRTTCLLQHVSLAFNKTSKNHIAHISNQRGAYVEILFSRSRCIFPLLSLAVPAFGNLVSHALKVSVDNLEFWNFVSRTMFRSCISSENMSSVPLMASPSFGDTLEAHLAASQRKPRRHRVDLPKETLHIAEYERQIDVFLCTLKLICF